MSKQRITKDHVMKWIYCLLLFTAAAAQAGPELLSFPARGVVDVREGTIECWIRFTANPFPEEIVTGDAEYLPWGPLVHITTGDPFVKGIRFEYFPGFRKVLVAAQAVGLFQPGCTGMYLFS